MRLADWLNETKKSQAWLAQEVGVTPGRIAQLAGGQSPSLSLALKIERATKRRVRVYDWPVMQEAAE